MQPYPKEFYCPITQEVMKDPVIGPDAITYERTAIVSWLNAHGTSPMTRISMNESQLVPNLALRNSIEDRMKGPVAVPETVSLTGMEKTKEVLGVEDKLGLEISTMEAKEDTGLMHITVAPPKEGNRKPYAFICLLDSSESMNAIANLESMKEGNDFTVLDLVSHAVKTMVYMLGPEDYLALIAFSDSATVILNLMQMNEDGKRLALQSIETIKSQAGTNIWDALRVGVNMALTNHVCQKLNTCIWLFTDGLATLNPPRGIAPTLQTFIEGKNANVTIHTFGFGYQLDSYMLLSVAQIGNGVFCYLPDCNLVGTTFVNCLCNTLATAVSQATIEIASDDIKNPVCLGYDMKEGKIQTGCIQYGQPRDFIVEFQCPKGLHFDIKVKLTYGGKEVVKAINGIKTVDPIKSCAQLSRAKYCHLLMEGLNMRYTKKGDPKFLETLVNLLTSLPSKDDDLVKGLMRDLASSNPVEGRVSKAFSTAERIDRWGKHYIRSIVRAHQMQQCHNFKDPGVQIYGGKLFKELQQKADIVFCSLPPPIPSSKKEKITPVPDLAALEAPAGSGAPGAPEAPAAPMQEYLYSGGGCFDGEGIVKLANGTLKKIKELIKGDIVLSSTGLKSVVVCLIVFPINRKIGFSVINGVKLTAKHPIIQNGQWVYPKDVTLSEEEYCDEIYNLVLDSNHIISINGLDVVTLGHGKYDNEIVKHLYYGSERVVEDLKKIKGWDSGKISFDKARKLKDPFSGLLMRITTP